MKAIDRLREKLREIHPDSIPGTGRLTLSAEQLNLFFDGIVIPAFERIEKELKNFPLRIFIRRYPTTAQMRINDISSSFNFRLVIDNKISRLSISFHYRNKTVVDQAGNPLYSRRDAETIKYNCETMELVEYKKITEEYLIETFTECYFKREELAAGVIAESQAAEAEKFARALEERRRFKRKKPENTT